MFSPITPIVSNHSMDFTPAAQRRHEPNLLLAALVASWLYPPLERQIPTLLLITRKTVDHDRIAPFPGNYHNDVLGNIKLVLHEDHTLWIDFGEYESPIRPLITEENQFIFFESAWMGKTLQLKTNPNGKPTLKWTGTEGAYNFEATSTQEEVK